MSPETPIQRLSRISTLWDEITVGLQGPPEEAVVAQRRLMQRYCGAVYQYLLGALRNKEAATELLQEFAVRFLRGDFRREDPERGRFRDYVKKVLMNLVNDYRKAAQRQPRSLSTDPLDPHQAPDAADIESAFLVHWREELLTRSWAVLAEQQPTYFTVLLFQVRHPGVQSPELAQRMTEDLGKSFTASSIRVTLHRARERFADLLLDEVAHSLENPRPAELLH